MILRRPITVLGASAASLAFAATLALAATRAFAATLAFAGAIALLPGHRRRPVRRAGTGPRRGRRPLRPPRHPRRDRHRRHRCAAPRPGRHRHRGQPHHADRGRRLPRPPHRRVAPSPAGDHEIDAHGMYVLPGFVDMHLHTGGLPKTPQAEYVYKLWLAHGVTAAAASSTGPVDFSLSERERANNNEITAPRMFVYQRPDRAGTGAPYSLRNRPATGSAGRTTRDRRDQVRGLCARDHGGAPRRGQPARDGQRGPPRPARRRADERHRRRTPRPRHRHALLRALRGALRRPRCPALAVRHELRQRTAPLRAGRGPVGSDPPAGKRRVERDARGAPVVRRDPRPHHDRLPGQPRRDARAHRRMARALYAAQPVGLLRAQPREPRFVYYDWTTHDEIRWKNFYTSGWRCSTTTRTWVAASPSARTPASSTTCSASRRSRRWSFFRRPDSIRSRSFAAPPCTAPRPSSTPRA